MSSKTMYMWTPTSSHRTHSATTKTIFWIMFASGHNLNTAISKALQYHLALQIGTVSYLKCCLIKLLSAYCTHYPEHVHGADLSWRHGSQALQGVQHFSRVFAPLALAKRNGSRPRESLARVRCGDAWLQGIAISISGAAGGWFMAHRSPSPGSSWPRNYILQIHTHQLTWPSK